MPRPKLANTMEAELAKLPYLSRSELCAAWQGHYGGAPPPKLSRDLLSCAIAYKLQEKVHGRLPANMRSYMRELVNGSTRHPPAATLKPGTVLLREWHGTAYMASIAEREGVKPTQ